MKFVPNNIEHMRKADNINNTCIENLYNVCIATLLRDARLCIEATNLSSVIPSSVERETINSRANSSPVINLAKSIKLATHWCIHHYSLIKRMTSTTASHTCGSIEHNRGTFPVFHLVTSLVLADNERNNFRKVLAIS